MSQVPRWFRRREYERRLGLHDPNAIYLDQSDAHARRLAVTQQLDRDDGEYDQKQFRRIQQHLRTLKGLK